jgi:hypothetical protein
MAALLASPTAEAVGLGQPQVHAPLLMALLSLDFFVCEKALNTPAVTARDTVLN